LFLQKTQLKKPIAILHFKKNCPSTTQSNKVKRLDSADEQAKAH